jgi:DNA-binding MarR family transcriptional regulator
MMVATILSWQGWPMADFSLDRSLGFVANRAALRLELALARALAPFDVTPQQWALLNRLWEQDGLTQRELADRTFKDPPNTTRMLDKLERKGLVARRPDPDDRRVALIYLTERGRRLKADLIPLARGILARATQGIGEADLAVALGVLDRVADNLE